MGRLIDGVWQADDRRTDADGRFLRAETRFRGRVTADGDAGFPGVAGLHHFQNPAMGGQRPLRAAPLLQIAVAGTQQHILDGVDHLNQGGVVRGGSQGEMELGIGVDAGFALQNLPLLFLQDAMQPLEVGRGGPLRGEGGNLRFQQPPHFEDVLQPAGTAIVRRRQQGGYGVQALGVDERAGAGAGLHQPLPFQRADGFADGAAPHLELPGQRPLRGQARAVGQLAGANEGLQFADDVLVKPLPRIPVFAAAVDDGRPATVA